MVAKEGQRGTERSLQNVWQINEARENYKLRIKKNDKPMTLQRFCCFLDLDVANLYDYINGNHSVSDADMENYSQIRHALKRIYREILWDKVEKLETMKTTPVWLIFSMKNSFNRADKKEYDVKANISIDHILDELIK